MADVGRFYSSKGILMVAPMFLMHPLGFQHAVQNTFLCKCYSHVLNSTAKKKRASESNPDILGQTAAAASSFRIIRESLWKMRNGSGVTFYLTPPAAALGCGDSSEAPQPFLFSIIASCPRHLRPAPLPLSERCSPPYRRGRDATDKSLDS